MPINKKAKLIKKIQLKDDLFQFDVQAEEMAKTAKPGQFLEIKVSDEIEPLLRRPISIYNADKENGVLSFIFQVKGKGTKILAKREEGEEIDLLGPLGYGTFNILENKRVAIIGGGIGTFPLQELAKNLKGKSEVNVYLGFRSKDFVVLEKEFEKVSDRLVVTTDDGSYGISGFAINELKKDIEAGKIDYIYACGPLPMLKAVRELSINSNIPCQISLEERMGCGIGVCLGCAVKTAESTEENPQYLHVCKNGPVFDAEKVEI